MMEIFELVPDDTALVVIDIQKRLCDAMPEKHLMAALRSILNVMECCRRMGIPCMLTQQYTKGLGSTVPAVAEAVDRYGEMVTRLEKIDFSCMAVQAFREWVASTGRTRFILMGIETHVCVFQTTRDMIREGYLIHVPRDTTLSRSKSDWQTGLSLMERAGALITSAETVIFDLLKRAGTDRFREISKLVK